MAILILSSCAALDPRPVGIDERLAVLPRSAPGIERPVTIRWNEHLIPWIEAETDDDLAFALGLVHGHLRAGQILTLRNLARGRIAESAGPLATDIDHALRILDLGRAAPEIELRWPEETRRFVLRFLDGLNHAIATGPRPPEAGLFALKREPITVSDMLALSRLAGADPTWFQLIGLLAERGRPGYAEAWQRLREAGAGSAVPDGLAPAQARLAQLLADQTRSGSNSVAVGPGRSASGAAMIANDPHLALALPNPWIIVGVRSPSHHAVGMMIAGLPVIGLGRNEHVAWGGTNLRSAASDVFDITSLPEASLTTREETIRQRGWFTAHRQVRESPLGPVLSDAAILGTRPGERLALRWVGHEPTDEITALLRASRARSATEFRDHLAGFGVSPQNMLYVDRAGTIGRMVATALPARTGFPAADPVLDATRPEQVAPWQRLLTGRDLPRLENPPEGFLASANENPATWATNAPPIGVSFSDDDRVARLRAILAARPRLSVEDLVALQHDTLSPKAALLAEGLLRRLDALPGGAPQAAMLARLRGWNGSYAADNEGAVVFELLLGQLAPAIAAARGGVARSDWASLTTFLLRDLDALPPERREAILRDAAGAAAPLAARYRRWDEILRLRAFYAPGLAPVVGRLFTLGRYPSGGSRETPMKAGHGFVKGPVDVVFGAQARHVSDMADVDANWFSLWGGQDGWLGSAAFLSQIPLWQRSEAVRLPLRPEVVAREFPRVTRLMPQ
jgi:penicillin amidase